MFFFSLMLFCIGVDILRRCQKMIKGLETKISRYDATREHFQMLIKTPEQNSWLPLSQSFIPTNQTRGLSQFFRA